MTSLREIRILQQLDHENIVPIVEICRAKGTSRGRGGEGRGGGTSA
jgi:serine/threonine protein kinase